MANSRDRILLVENDSVVSDLVGRQALQAAGYQVFVASEASTAIAKALQWAPDLIITDINLPGLSGKDMLVALSSQGIQVPVIILAQRGLEADIIQAFRLGATDYLLLPGREAEVISAAERVLRQGRDRRERERLAQQLQQTNQELQLRVRELTTIFSVGKAVTSVTDQSTLLEKILEAAIRVTQADVAWFLLRDDADKNFVVVAEQNLPPSLGVKLNQPWDDGISSLVAMSGETFSIHGDPLKRFKIYGLGQSALVVPIKAQQKKVVGLLALMRKQANPFGSSEQHLLEALADYASISLVNARLFRTVEERARAMQQSAEAAQRGGKMNLEVLEKAHKELQPPLENALSTLDKLVKDPTARWRQDQRQLLSTLQDQLLAIGRVDASLASHNQGKGAAEKPRTVVGDVARVVLQKLQPYVQQGGMSLAPEIPAEPLAVCLEAALVGQILEGLLSHIIRFSSPGALIGLRLGRSGDQVHGIVRTSGLAIDPKELEKMLEQPGAAGRSSAGARLNAVKEQAAAQGSKIWLEYEPGKETAFRFTLPLYL